MTKLHTNPTVAACKLTIPALYDVWLCGRQLSHRSYYLLIKLIPSGVSGALNSIDCIRYRLSANTVRANLCQVRAKLLTVSVLPSLLIGKLYNSEYVSAVVLAGKFDSAKVFHNVTFSNNHPPPQTGGRNWSS
jgi:hypothetical protein